MVNVLTDRENEIINKRIHGRKLSQNESNILSKYIRPKLRKMEKINPEEILEKIEYNQKARAIEKKVKGIVLENIPKSKVSSVILTGSAVQNRYEKYNDIDVIISTKKSIKGQEKNKMIKKIEKEGKKKSLNLDIQIHSEKSILNQYSRNPSLIYQLKDSKIIYGNLKLPEKISLYGLDLMMKLDWSEGLTLEARSEEIYRGIRNALLVLLLINKKVSNRKLNENLIALLGEDLINKLKNNAANMQEKKLALNYLKLLTRHLETKLKNLKWEKIEIKNH